MTVLDNYNYETYISYTGEKEEIDKFKASVFNRGFFSFPAILPVPEEITKNPMIENKVYISLMLTALKADPKIHYYGNIRDKMSMDRFYKEIILPYRITGIKYQSYDEEAIKRIAFKDESPEALKAHTTEDAISVLLEKGDADGAADAIKRMHKYGCATRYAWRTLNWGAPMEATGCQIRPEEAKVAPHSEDAIMVYTSGGNGLKVLQFMAKKFPKLTFEIIWKRIDEDGKTPEDFEKGEYQQWVNGKLVLVKNYFYPSKGWSGSSAGELEDMMDNLKATFREGWDKK